jgi:hypothetical protein
MNYVDWSGKRVVLLEEDTDPDLGVTVPAGTNLKVEGVEGELLYVNYKREEIVVDAKKCRLA